MPHSDSFVPGAGIVRDPQCLCDHTRSLHLVTAGFCLAAGQAGQACCCTGFQQQPPSLFPAAERSDLPSHDVL
jgi:hypothetical protein